jgi:Tfp pilus assembly protein PilN
VDQQQKPRWQPTRKQLLWAGSITSLAFLLIVICSYLFGWKWTGLPKKTLWDYLELLIVPAALALGVYWLNRRRADTIIAQLTQANAALAARVPELEAAQERPGAPEAAAQEPERAEPRPATEEAQTTTEHPQAQRPTEGVEHEAGALREWTGDVEGRRPWWRRMFGG